jgi:hypothetical protein
MFNIFSSNKIYTCSKHNYTGINSPCPDCGLVEAGVMQKITEFIRQEIKDWGVIYCKDIEEGNKINKIVNDQIKLFAEHIASYLEENASNFTA